MCPHCVGADPKKWRLSRAPSGADKERRQRFGTAIIKQQLFHLSRSPFLPIRRTFEGLNAALVCCPEARA
jgi:hypothetical protein